MSDITEAAKSLLAPEPEGQPKPDEELEAPETEVEEPEVLEAETEASDGDADDVETDQPEDADEVEEPEDEDDPVIEIQTKRGVEEVKFSELQQGYMREKDYTQKTQSIAADRREFDAEKATWAETSQHQNAQLQDALATFAIDQTDEPDWATVDPAQYPKLRADWDNKGKQKQQAADMYRQLQQSQHAENVAREKVALLSVFPEWQDQEVFNSAATDMVALGGKYGFQPDEMNALVDHRMLRILHDLGRLRKIEDVQKVNASKVKKKIVKAAKRLSPGVKPERNQQANTVHRQKSDRFKKSGSLKDAAALLRAD